MSFYANVRVRLASDIRKVKTKSGIEMASGFGFVNVESDNGFPLGIVAFGSLSEAILKSKKGDTLAVMGALKANDYTSKSGEEVNGYQLVCDSVMSVKKASGSYAEPKPRKPKKGASPEAKQAAHDNFGLNDSLDF